MTTSQGDELRSTIQTSTEREYTADLEAAIEKVKAEHAARVTAAVDKAVAAIRGKNVKPPEKAKRTYKRKPKTGLPQVPHGDLDRVDDLVPPAVSDAEL